MCVRDTSLATRTALHGPDTIAYKSILEQNDLQEERGLTGGAAGAGIGLFPKEVSSHWMPCPVMVALG